MQKLTFAEDSTTIMGGSCFRVMKSVQFLGDLLGTQCQDIISKSGSASLVRYIPHLTCTSVAHVP